MSGANELLDSLTEGDVSAYTATPNEEGHIVIGIDRSITVPSSLKRIAVEHDHNIETVTFDCPRYWDGIDMSGMKIYINYKLSNNYYDAYPADNVTADTDDESIMHFDWTITRNVTQVDGSIIFAVCIKELDEEGNELRHWNTELCNDMYVSDGLECDENGLIDAHPDFAAEVVNRINGFEASVDAFSADVSRFSEDLEVAVNITNETEAALDEIIAIQESLIGGNVPNMGSDVQRTIIIRDTNGNSIDEVIGGFEINGVIGSLPAYGTDNIWDYIEKVGYVVFTIYTEEGEIFNFYMDYVPDDAFMSLTYRDMENFNVIITCYPSFDTENDMINFHYDGYYEPRADIEMSDESEKPVQNKVVKSYIDNAVSGISMDLTHIGYVPNPIYQSTTTPLDVTDKITFKPAFSEIMPAYNTCRPMTVTAEWLGSGDGHALMYYFDALEWNYHGTDFELYFHAFDRDYNMKKLMLVYKYSEDDQTTPQSITAHYS